MKNTFFLRYIVLFYILLITSLLSCNKKNNENDVPIIIIESPVTDAVFLACDSIQVKATISGILPITDIRISLLNTNRQQVSEPLTISTNTTHYVIDLLYGFCNNNLLSGNYYLQIICSNSYNNEKKLIPIYINETPKELESTFVVTEKNQYFCIYKINKEETLSTITTTTSDYAGAEIDNTYKMLYYSGKQTGDFNAYSITDSVYDWKINAISQLPLPYFTNISLYNNNLYVSYFNNKFEKRDFSGTIKATVNTSNTYYPEFILETANTVLVEEKRISTGGYNRITSYYTNSLASYQEYMFWGDMVSIVPINNNDMVFFINNNDSAIIEFFSIDINGCGQPLIIENDSITSVVKINNDEILFATQNSGIQILQPSSLSHSQYLNTEAHTINYNEVDNELWTSNKNTIAVYNYTSKQPIKSYTLSVKVKKCLFYYNKGDF